MIYTPSVAQVLARNFLAPRKEAALFMGCGLGKTAACLDVVNDLFLDGATDGVLIVAPIRVCNMTWPDEVRKWDQFRWMKVANLRTTEGWEALERGDAQIYLINYELLPDLAVHLKERKKLKIKLPFDTVIWDELTRAKNHKSKRIKSVYQLFREKLKRHWGLTGTPAPNGLLDLFGQIRLLDGGERLGKTFSLYQQTYFQPTDFMEYNWVPREGARERIYKRLEGFALTLTSKEYLNIPDVVVEDIPVKLSDEAREIYEEMEKELIVQLEDETFTSANAAVLVNKLQQITGGALYGEEAYRIVGEDKMNVARDFIAGLGGEPVIIVCQYQHEQDRLRKMLSGMRSAFFSDARSAKDQDEMCRQWNRGEITALVAHPASIGHGLNLQAGGSTILWFSLTWSRELYDQVIARLARRGQTEVTTIYRLMATATIDDAVAHALRKKDDEQNNLLSALRLWADTYKQG